MPLSRLRTWVILTAIVVAAVYVLILWTLRRGFDWTDEAWAYSLISNGHVGDGEAWGFQYLLHPVFGVFGESVLAFRVLRLAAYVTISVVSTFVFGRIAASAGFVLRSAEWALLLLMSQVGTFLAWSFPPRYFAYNELSGFLAQLGVLILTVLLADAAMLASPLRRRSARALWAASGAIVVFLTVSKFTAGAILGAFALMALVTARGRLRLAERLLLALSGSIGGLMILWLLGVPITTYVGDVVALLTDGEARAAAGHPIRSLLDMYRESVFDTAHISLVPILLFTLSIGLFLAVSNRDAPHRSLARAGGSILGAFFLVALVTMPRIDSFPSLGRFIFIAGALAAVSFIALGVRFAVPASVRRAPLGVAGLLLAAAPFVAAVGTNMLIVGQALYSATIWFTLLGLALLALGREMRGLGGVGRAFAPALMLVVVAIAGTQVVGEVDRHPYRSTPYLSQAYSVGVPPLEGILVTAQEASWARWIADEADALRADDIPTIAVAAPGALLLFNNSEYASPWLDAFWPSSFDSVAEACSQGPPPELLVLQPGNVTPDTVQARLLVEALSTCGIEFPADFVVVARYPSEVPQFEMTIWGLGP